jgi:cytochrome c oxidase subunit 2
MKNWLIITAIIIVLVLGGAYYVFSGKSVSGNVVLSNDNVRLIQVNASSFEYSPNVINLKKGEKVRIEINDLDGTHGINIPEFGVKGVGFIEFTPDKTGTFAFRCPTYCGEGHREMTGTIIVSE